MMEYKVDRLVKCFAGIFGVLREEKGGGGGGEIERMIEIMSKKFILFTTKFFFYLYINYLYIIMIVFEMPSLKKIFINFVIKF